MITSISTLVTESGRRIRIHEAGHPDGEPILVHNGSPGSRLLYHLWVEDALSRRIRLISYDRPGYGGSTPHPNRTVASAADDVATIAQGLGLDRLSVWGLSGGGPHALACAALLPDLVIAAAVLASPAPYLVDGLNWFAEMGEGKVVEFKAALEGRDPLTRYLEAVAAGLLAAEPNTLVQLMGSLLSAVDSEVLTEDFATYLYNSNREGLADRLDGWIDDDIAFTKFWGFELDRIRIPVLLLHGRQDQFIPFSHGEWLASKITNVDARLSADDGHLTLGVLRIPEVHSWLLNKMA
jgi:pimeloyl-ACP methyl ester carboxylesterase